VSQDSHRRSRDRPAMANAMFAERLHVGVDPASGLLRGSAHGNSRRLSEVARAIVDSSERVPAPPGPRDGVMAPGQVQ